MGSSCPFITLLHHLALPLMCLSMRCSLCVQVRFFVLDEADRLLDTGNQDTIMQIFRRFPKTGAGANRLQVLMFSATLHSDDVKKLASQICQNPIVIDLKGKDSVPETVHHVTIVVDPREDKSWLQTSPKVVLCLFCSFGSVVGGSAALFIGEEQNGKLEDAREIEQCCCERTQSQLHLIGT